MQLFLYPLTKSQTVSIINHSLHHYSKPLNSNRTVPKSIEYFVCIFTNYELHFFNVSSNEIVISPRY